MEEIVREQIEIAVNKLKVPWVYWNCREQVEIAVSEIEIAVSETEIAVTLLGHRSYSIIGRLLSIVAVRAILPGGNWPPINEFE